MPPEAASSGGSVFELACLPGLGALADPHRPIRPIKITGSSEEWWSAWERMVLVRAAEEKIATKVEDGTIRCPCHLAIGQEAAALGVAMALRDSDRAFGAHRSHAHFLTMGGSLEGLFAEVLGRDSGVSRGMGGSMHLRSVEHGFWGSVPIVAATIPVAVGAGLAARMDGNGDVAVAFFGDGATEEGAFHEAMNLAVMLKAPVLFVCENNLFASHLHVSHRQPTDSTRRHASSHGLPGATVDGNDVVVVRAASEEAVTAMRAGAGPHYLECATYRWRGHVGHREDVDVGVKRKEDLSAWKAHDPIARLEVALLGVGSVNAAELEERRRAQYEQVEHAWESIVDVPLPQAQALLDRVYVNSLGPDE